ncbi:MAG: FtsQ-type POTRA domain-containing protein, partial [Clostridia bacterium]|nr:FtsQ-type POTRA domain-containing protein [Clostridia bacterium]
MAKKQVNNKSKLKRRQKKQLAFLTMITLVAALIAVILLTPAFNVNNIEITGNSMVSDEEIIMAGGLSKNVNILNVDTDAAEENIKSLPYIKKAEIKRSFPDTIKIKVTEEVGVAYFTTKDGYVIIASDGKCIDVSSGLSEDKNSSGQVAQLPKLPVIKGIKNVKYSKGEIVKSEDSHRLKSLFVCLHEFARQGYIFDMKEIDMSDPEDIRFYYKGKELCVSVGNTQRIGYKMECFRPIYEEVVNMTKKGQLPKGFIDLEHNSYRENIEIPTKNAEDTEAETKKA